MWILRTLARGRPLLTRVHKGCAIHPAKVVQCHLSPSNNCPLHGYGAEAYPIGEVDFDLKRWWKAARPCVRGLAGRPHHWADFVLHKEYSILLEDGSCQISPMFRRTLPQAWTRDLPGRLILAVSNLTKLKNRRVFRIVIPLFLL